MIEKSIVQYLCLILSLVCTRFPKIATLLVQELRPELRHNSSTKSVIVSKIVAYTNEQILLPVLENTFFQSEARLASNKNVLKLTNIL